MVNSDDFILGAFAAAVFVGFIALGALVRMQDRLAELKTERDDALGERDEVKEQLATSQRSLAQVANAIEMVTGLNAVQKLNPPYVGRTSIPDTTRPAEPATEDPWEAEMRERWSLDLPTSEDS